MITLYLTLAPPGNVVCLVVWSRAVRPYEARDIVDRVALDMYPTLNLWTPDANLINALPVDKHPFRVITDSGEWSAEEAAQFKARVAAGVERPTDILYSMGLY